MTTIGGARSAPPAAGYSQAAQLPRRRPELEILALHVN